jgi:hypothetical protein
MLNKCLGLLLLTALIFSCKKKESTPSQPNNPTPANAGTTGGVPTTTLSPSTGGEFCSLRTTYTYYDYNGVVSKDSSAAASFYATPPTSVAPTYIFGGTVTLNGIELPYSSSANSYYNGFPNPFNIAGPLTWSVSGSGTVTPFSQSFTPSYPKYTGGNLLPDTCIKANGITINISGVTNNQNSVFVYLFASSSSAFKYILGSSGTVTFTPSDLSSFTPNQSLSIMIFFGNYYQATLGGIKRGFANTVSYQKVSYLK